MNTALVRFTRRNHFSILSQSHENVACGMRVPHLHLFLNAADPIPYTYPLFMMSHPLVRV